MISSLIFHSKSNVCALLHDMCVYYTECTSLHSSSSHNLLLPSFMTNHWIFNRSNTTGVTSGAGYVHPYWTSAFNPVLCGLCCSIFSVLCSFCILLFVLFFLTLYCVSFQFGLLVISLSSSSTLSFIYQGIILRLI